MTNAYATEENLIKTTLEYGQGYCDLTIDDLEKRTSIYDFSKEVGEDLLYYHINKIRYKLSEKQTIQYMKIFATNMKDGTKKTILDTENPPDKPEPEQDRKEGEQDFDLKENEEIMEVHFFVEKKTVVNDEKGQKDNKTYITKEKLNAIRIKTNLNNIVSIGNTDAPNQENVLEEKLEKNDNIVIGFGVNACKYYGITSMFCYIVDKIKYGIFRNLGVLQLRAKLKKDASFKTELEKENLTGQKKLLFDVCNLPDASFFPVFSYLMGP